MPAMPLPTMYRVRQSFPRQRLADVPAGVRATMAQADLPIKRGDVVAVGAGSRGIANVAVIVRAVVDHLKELGARPFVFPAMGDQGQPYGNVMDYLLRRDGLEHWLAQRYRLDTLYYGRDFGTANCEFRRHGASRTGRR